MLSVHATIVYAFPSDISLCGNFFESKLKIVVIFGLRAIAVPSGATFFMAVPIPFAKIRDKGEQGKLYGKW